MSSNELTKSLSENIINPILDLTIKKLFFHKIFRFKIGNSTICIDKFLYQILNFMIILLIIYLIIKYVFRTLIIDTIKNKKLNDIHSSVDDVTPMPLSL